MKVQVLMKRSVMAHDQSDKGQMLPLKRYEKGKEYEISESLCKNLITLQACEEVAVKEAAPAEKEIKKGAPENKMLDHGEDFGTADLEEVEEKPKAKKQNKGKSLNAKQGAGKKGK